MIEKVTLKDTFAGLTKATDVDSIIARDKNGNPVYISKADLAAVAAELMFKPKTLSDFSELDNVFYYSAIGVYYYAFQGGTINQPDIFRGEAGFVTVRKIGGASTVQFAYVSYKQVYIRYWGAGINEWSDWEQMI